MEGVGGAGGEGGRGGPRLGAGRGGWVVGRREGRRVAAAAGIAWAAAGGGAGAAALEADLRAAAALVAPSLEVVGAFVPAGEGPGGARAAAEALQARVSVALRTVGGAGSLLMCAAAPGGGVSVFEEDAPGAGLVEGRGPAEWSKVGAGAGFGDGAFCLRMDLFLVVPLLAGGAPAARRRAAANSVRDVVAELRSGDCRVLVDGGYVQRGALCGTSPEAPTMARLVVRACPPDSGGASSEGPAAGPSLAYEPLASGPAPCHVVRLEASVLGAVADSGQATGQQVLSMALAGLEAQLWEVARQLGDLEDAAAGRPHVFRALNFLPPGTPFPVTLVYDLGRGTDGDLRALERAHRDQRLEAHARLALGTERPAFKMSNALAFGEGEGDGTSGGKDGPRLANVHTSLPPSSVGGTVSLVQGDYMYYHYMQDRFDDNGWGCAYRSLQTICSWFRRQHYTSVPVPSHRAIQETLHKVGDKPAKFVGSRQWIGAIEISYVLDELLGVQSKVITVPSGAEIPTRARELARHFETQGTPIMIGGGVLAYTLLGVDFNELTGDCAFLILDPHYTGREDLGRIHAGSWVSWKQLGDKAAAGGDLFVRDAFYNFLCPQRPKEAA